MESHSTNIEIEAYCVLNIVLDLASGNKLVNQKNDKAPDLREFENFISQTICSSKLLVSIIPLDQLWFLNKMLKYFY